VLRDDGLCINDLVIDRVAERFGERVVDDLEGAAFVVVSPRSRVALGNAGLAPWFAACGAGGLVRHDGAFGGTHFFEEPDQRYAAEAKHAEEPEVVHVSHEHRLLLQNAEHHAARLLRAFPCAALRGESVLDRGEMRAIKRVEWREMADEQRLRGLRAARVERGQRGDAEAAAEVSHEIEYACGVAHLLLAERAHGRGR